MVIVIAKLINLANQLDALVAIKEASQIDKLAEEMGKLLDLDAFRKKRQEQAEKKNRPEPDIGPVISGTADEAEIARALIAELRRYDQAKASSFHEEFRAIMSHDEPDPQFLSDLLLDLGDTLNKEVAPEGLFFGANPADPTDIGWWPEEEGEFWDPEGAADDKIHILPGKPKPPAPKPHPDAIKNTLGPKGR